MESNFCDIELEAEVRRCLPDLSDGDVVMLVSYLQVQGVLYFKHLQHLTEEEIVNSRCVTKIQAKRLISSCVNSNRGSIPDIKENAGQYDQGVKGSSPSKKGDRQNEKKQNDIQDMYERVKRIQADREDRSKSPNTAWANLDRKAQEEYQRKRHKEIKENHDEHVTDIWSEPDQTIRPYLPTGDYRTVGAIGGAFAGFCIVGFAAGPAVGAALGGVVGYGIAAGLSYASGAAPANSSTDNENIDIITTQEGTEN